MGQSERGIWQQRVRYEVPGAGSVRMRSELGFPAADGATLPFDLYLPPAGWTTQRRPPVVLICEGYPDAGFARLAGAPFRKLAPVTSWARLLAASGLAAVVGSNRVPAPDALALARHLAARGAELEVDGDRLGVWASSGNAPVGLSLLLDRSLPVRSAALLYPFLVDLGGATEVASAAASFRFADACAERSPAELAAERPLLLVRAGGDATPGLLASLDRFAAAAARRERPVRVLEVPGAPHGFDLLDGGAATRGAIRAVLDFLRATLDPAAAGAGS